MNPFLILFSVFLSLLSVVSLAATETVTVDVSGVVSSIYGLGIIAIAILGASIVVSLTIMVYRKVKSYVYGRYNEVSGFNEQQHFSRRAGR